MGHDEKIIKEFFDKVVQNRSNLKYFCEFHGLSYNTLKGWRSRKLPSIAYFCNTLDKFGYELTIRPKRNLYGGLKNG